MLDVVGIFLAVLLAVLTLVLAEFLRSILSPRLRIVLPFVVGIVLALLFFTSVLGLLLNLFSSRIPLIEFFYMTLPLIFPLFIIPSLLLIEKQTGARFGKSAIILGSFATIILFYLIRQSGLVSYDLMQRVEFFMWTAGIFLISLVVFACVYVSQHIFSGHTRENQDNPDQLHLKKIPDRDTIKHTPLFIGLLVLVALILLSSAFMSAFYMPFHDDNRGGANLEITPVNISETSERTAIHLTDANLQQYPELASLINTNAEMTYLPCGQELQMQKEGLISSGSSPHVYLEYQGKYFTASILHHAGTYC